MVGGDLVTAYQRIAKELRHLIVDGGLAAGARIGTEQELCERWQASRTTIRRALGQLAEEGLLISHQGAGWFVSEPPKVFQHLAQLEALSDILTRYGETAHQVTAFGSIKPPPHVVEALKLDDDAMVVEIERVHTLQKQPIAVTHIWLLERVGSHLSLADVKAGPVFPTLPARAGVRIATSNQVIRANVVDKRNAEFIDVKPGSPVLEVDRVCFTDEGQAVAAVRVLYRADRFELRMSLKWHDAESLISPGIGLLDDIVGDAM